MHDTMIGLVVLDKAPMVGTITCLLRIGSCMGITKSHDIVFWWFSMISATGLGLLLLVVVIRCNCYLKKAMNMKALEIRVSRTLAC